MPSALFDINADGLDQGYDASNSEALTITLRNTAGVQSARLQVFDAAGFDVTQPIATNPPRQSPGAPELDLDNGVDPVAQAVDFDPITGSITTTLPSSGLHSWIVRCIVNGGVSPGPDGLPRPDPTLIKERMIAIVGLNNTRKVIATETTQYSDDGWVGAVNTLVDGGGGGGGSGAGSLAPVRFRTIGDDTLSGLAARDGVTPSAGDRVLVMEQTAGQDNGIYDAAAGAWTRASDFNEDVEVIGGVIVAVNEGTLYADTRWTLTTDDPITVGTTPQTWEKAVLKGLAETLAEANTTGGTDIDITAADKIDYQGEVDLQRQGTTVIETAAGPILWAGKNVSTRIGDLPAFPQAVGTYSLQVHANETNTSRNGSVHTMDCFVTSSGAFGGTAMSASVILEVASGVTGSSAVNSTNYTVSRFAAGDQGTQDIVRAGNFSIAHIAGMTGTTTLAQVVRAGMGPGAGTFGDFYGFHAEQDSTGATITGAYRPFFDEVAGQNGALNAFTSPTEFGTGTKATAGDVRGPSGFLIQGVTTTIDSEDGTGGAAGGVTNVRSGSGDGAGAGGDVNVQAGAGGATDATGGAASLQAGGGGGTAGVGGSASVVGGSGGSAGNGGTGSVTGGQGQGAGTGGLGEVAGGGGAAAGTAGNGQVKGGNAGTPGKGRVLGGDSVFGAGTAGGQAEVLGGSGDGVGAGGAATVTGGAAGATDATGGAATLTGAAGGGSAGAGGEALVTGGVGQGAAAGGQAKLEGGTSATGTPGRARIAGGAGGLFGGNAGGAAEVFGGDGDAGGDVTVEGGTAGGTGNFAGGNVAVNGGNSQGTNTGGTVKMTAGVGGGTDATGGVADLTGGAGGGTNGAGGGATVKGGLGKGTGIGGQATLQGGDSAQTAGVAVVVGGAATASSGIAGGTAGCQGGTGDGAGAGGLVAILGGIPGATGVGGAASLSGGAGGATSGAGGEATVAGGDGTAGNGDGGHVNISEGTAHGTGTDGGLRVFSTTATMSGERVVYQANGTAPTVNPSAGGFMYIESGARKYRGSSGTITVLGPA